MRKIKLERERVLASVLERDVIFVRHFFFCLHFCIYTNHSLCGLINPFGQTMNELYRLSFVLNRLSENGKDYKEAGQTIIKAIQTIET